MSIIQGNSKSAAGGFDPELIGNSIWLDGSTDYLTRTPSAGTTTRWIVGFWVQRHAVATGTAHTIFSAGTAVGNLTWIRFDDSDNLDFAVYQGSVTARKTSNAKYRDTATWYHVCVSFDSASGVTAADRIKMFVNGVEVTSLSASTSTPTDETTAFNDNILHEIGRYSFTGGADANVSLAQFCMIENKSFQNSDLAITDLLDSYTFGSGSQFGPKSNSDAAALCSAAGSESFCLDFADSGGTGAANLGNDISSKESDFAPQAMSAANQSTNTPSLNYAVLNVLDKGSSATTSEGATTQPTATDHVILSSIQIPTTGKWAISGRVDAGDFSFGICTQAHTRTSKIGRTNDSWGAIDAPGASFFRSEHDSVGSNSTSAVSAASDTFIIAFDADSGKLWLGRNDGGAGIAYLGGGNPATGATPTYTLSSSEMSPGLHFAVGSRLTVSFGQRTHFETLPTDFLELNSANLPTPDAQGVDHFQPVLYTGNGSARSISTDIDPAWVWIKNRGTTDNHKLVDSVRGATKELSSNLTAVESTDSNGVTAFGTGSFSLGSGANGYNDSSENFVAWCWEAGTAFSNDASATSIGTLDSSGRVSASGAFSIATYTGNATAGATFKHGLAVKPELILFKRYGSTTANWMVHHVDAGVSNTDWLMLDTNGAKGYLGAVNFLNATAPNTSVVTLGDDSNNNAADTYVTYNFASVPGVCKVGSYVGNGAADGSYVSVGFRPRWLLIKSTAARDWVIFDTARDPDNVSDTRLDASNTGAEFAAALDVDILSDGFKFRSTDIDGNSSGVTYLTLCMADIASGAGLCPIYGR